MAKQTFKASNLRALLAFLLIAVVIGGGALFYYGLGIVRDYSVEVNHRLKDADASGRQVQQLQFLKNQLAQSESLISKADKLFATPGAYQGQVLTDLRSYANKTGLSIESTDFSNPAETGEYSVAVTLRQPVSYRNLIQFLEYVETSLPKLQVSAIELSPASNASADSVSVGTIKINVSVR